MQRLKILPYLLAIIIFSSCSHLNKATDLITNPTSKERYQRDFNISNELMSIWEEQAKIALSDSIKVDLPYIQAGNFSPRNFPVYSYNLYLKPGEKLDVMVETDTVGALVFIEIYIPQNDSLRPFRKIAGSNYGEGNISLEIEQATSYKVLIQPEIEAATPFTIKMRTTPIYSFPVAGGKNNNIQSFWGATRDGGRRSHEGIDIFAPRGTPVVAVTEGRISSSGEKGLGGKQVWIRDLKRGQSLYYAHLDSIAPMGNARVKPGDTIGFVGNTGNAKTTPPHLHFGIYRGYRGAIDPLPHVLQMDEPNFETPPNLPTALNLITKSTANLRDQPTTNKSRIIGSSPAQDTLQLLGKSSDWFHVRTAANQAAFIHESLVTPL